MGACTARRASRVVVGVLVERDVVCRVPITEDVTAFAAVVPACEIIEAAHARGFVAHGRFGIRLELLTCQLFFVLSTLLLVAV